MGRVAPLPLSVILATASLLVTHTQAEPFQCQQLQPAIPECTCRGNTADGVENDSEVVIDCRNIGLTALPTITSYTQHEIYEMKLEQNNIRVLPADHFDGLKIQRINLRDNPLVSIDDRAFQGLEDYLQELYIGAGEGTNVQFSVASITNLTQLQTLHLSRFTFPLNELKSGQLNRLATLKSLTLEHNNLTFIAGGALPTDLINLKLNHQDLTTLPFDLLQSLTKLEHLTVTNTRLDEIHNDFQANTRLVYLDLGYNAIIRVLTNAFGGITSSLKTLSLRNNPLSSVDQFSEVKTLTALTSLHLSETQLTSLPQNPQFLLNKASLSNLYLDGNSLSTLDDDTFSNLGALSSLHLHNNRLANNSMSDQAFAGLSSLRYLDLGHQTMATGEKLTLPESLTQLTSLQTLNLSSAVINQSTLWQRLGALTNLQYLHLDNTALSTLPAYAFMNLTQLKELFLDNNGMSSITQQNLAGLRSLEKLTLNSNQLTTLSECIVHGFLLSTPLQIEAIANPLHCDCTLRWLLKEEIQLSEFETCSSPPDKANEHLINFQPTDLTCTPPPTTTSCLDLYTTTALPDTTTPPTPELILTVVNVSATSMDVSWAVSNLPGLTHFRISFTDLSISQQEETGDITSDKTSFKLTGLKTSTTYSVCIFAYSTSFVNPPNNCTTRSTDGQPGGQTGDDTPDNTGVIVGVVVGIVVLLVIVAVIVYLLVLRKRNSAKEQPAQPHIFTPSELPGVSASSRQFAKPKEKHQPKVGRALDENIKVTVISEGHTGPASPSSRQSGGSYQFLNENHPNPTQNLCQRAPTPTVMMWAQGLYPLPPWGPWRATTRMGTQFRAHHPPMFITRLITDTSTVQTLASWLIDILPCNPETHSAQVMQSSKGQA